MKYYTILLIAVVLLSVACTDEDNRTGVDGNILNSEEVIVPGSSITNVWNYRDTVQTYDGSTVFTVGNFQNTTLMSLLRWSSFPSDATALSATMYLVPSDDHLPDSITVQVGVIDENWEEDSVTWTNVDDEGEWENTEHVYEPITSFTYREEVDTLTVEIPLDLIQSWLDNVGEDETNNFGIILFSDTPDQVIEIFTLETSYAPLLEIEYLSDGDTLTYSKDAVDDATIYHNPDEDATLGLVSDGFVISNIYPYRSVVELEFDLESFNALLTQQGYAEMNEYDYRHSTINRAELVFQIDTANSYFMDDTFSARAYMMLTDEPSVPLIYTDDYLFYSGTDVSYYDSDSQTIRVDVSPILQAIMAGEADNYGFVIRSIEEDRDLGRIFMTSNPTLDILFTRPFVEEF